MKKLSLILFLAGTTVLVASCKKKGCIDETALNYNAEAEKDDGSCAYSDLNIPSTYTFTDEGGNSTVAYSGQTERLNQLEEMTTYMKTGTGALLEESILLDMFANTGENGGGNFSFSSTKQLENKCFASDVDQFKTWITELVAASTDFAETASNGQAGILTTGSSTYLFDANGREHIQFIEKGLMGAVFLHQANNVYFGSDKMDVDNSTVVNAAEGKYYTEMEHHWDEAFGYFGAPTDFLTNTADLRFWAKYCNVQDSNLGGANAILMNAFLKGRAVISQGTDLAERDTQIKIIRQMWERVSASQAKTYLEEAIANFGTDDARYLHVLSEAYAFILNLKYVSLDTRVIEFTEIEALLDAMGDNFWELTLADINGMINTLDSIYNF